MPSQRAALACIFVLMAAVANARVSAGDADDAKKVVSRAIESIHREDAKELRSLIITEDPISTAWVDTLVDAVIARQRLNRLSTRIFGQQLPAVEDSEFPFYIDDDLQKRWTQALAAATVTGDNDRMRIEIPISNSTTHPADRRPSTRPTAQAIVLQKQDGNWMIMPDVWIKGASTDREPPDEREQALFRSLYEKRTRAWQSVADDIEAHRIESHREADQAVRDRA